MGEIGVLLSFVWNLFLFILSVLLIVAVFRTSSATQQSALLLERLTAQIATAMHHMGVQADHRGPSCRNCLSTRGKEVHLVRVSPRRLQCPECKATRDG